MGPVSRLTLRSRIDNFVKVHRPEGNEPPKELEDISKEVSSESPESSDGSVPVRLLEDRERVVTFLEDEQVRPLHAEGEEHLLSTLAQVQEGRMD